MPTHRPGNNYEKDNERRHRARVSEELSQKHDRRSDLRVGQGYNLILTSPGFIDYAIGFDDDGLLTVTNYSTGVAGTFVIDWEDVQGLSQQLVALETAYQDADTVVTNAYIAADAVVAADAASANATLSTTLTAAYQAADATQQTEIDGLDTRVTSSEASITTLQSTTASNTGAISTIQTDLTAETTARTNADTALDGRLTTAEGTIVTNTASISTNATAITTNTNSIATLETSLTATYSSSITSGGQVLPNWDLSLLDADDRPAGIQGVESASSRVQFDPLNPGLSIQGVTDPNVAAGFPAIPIDDELQYEVTIRHQSTATSATGLYLRFNESSVALTDGNTHLGAAGQPGVQSRTSLVNLVDDGPMPGTTLVEDTFIYTPTPGTKHASFSMYNWTGFTGDYYVYSVQIRPLVAPLSNSITTNTANISTNATAIADEESARASAVATLTASVNGNTSSINTNATAIADIEGNISASYTLTLDVNGKVTGVKFTNDGTTGTFSIGADIIDLGDDTTYEDTHNTFYTEAGGYRYRDRGPFGASSDLLTWWGPDSVALNSETTTNGIFAVATDGKVYYGNAELNAAVNFTASYAGLWSNTTGSAANFSSSTSVNTSGLAGAKIYYTQIIDTTSLTSKLSVTNPTSVSPTLQASGFSVSESESGTIQTTVTDTTTGQTTTVQAAFTMTRTS